MNQQQKTHEQKVTWTYGMIVSAAGQIKREWSKTADYRARNAAREEYLSKLQKSIDCAIHN